MSERFANYLIRCNYRDFHLKNVIINYNEPKKEKIVKLKCHSLKL